MGLTEVINQVLAFGVPRQVAGDLNYLLHCAVNKVPVEKTRVSPGNIHQVKVALTRYHNTHPLTPAVDITRGVYRLRLVPDVRREADISEFSRLLYAMCDLSGVDAANRTAKLGDWLKISSAGNSEFRGQARTLWNGKDPVRDFDKIFEHFSAQGQISMDDMRFISEMFGFHSLLLFPLLANYERTGPLTLDLDDHFVEVEKLPKLQPAGTAAGTAGPYSIPAWRLERADATIGLVELDNEYPKSDQHSHPGDELVLILSGSIDFQFGQPGNCIHLEKGDLAHFYAETSHQAIKHSHNARMLVIRFYQIDAQTRQKLWRNLVKHLKSGTVDQLPPHAAAWILQALPSYRPPGHTQAVADGLGLARMLTQIAKWKGAKIEESDLPEEQRTRLENADPEAIAEIGSLANVAKAYDVEDFLLQGFGFPAIAGEVILKRKWDDTAKTYNFSEHDFEEFHDPNSPKVLYRLPKRSLSCSDISIAYIELPPNVGTPSNSHPGLELLFIEFGQLSVTVDGVEKNISQTGPQLCHFYSDRDHVVKNDGAGPARFWVMRFYRDGIRNEAPNDPISH